MIDANTPPAFVHLRVHTEFSVVDGIARIPDLVKRAAQFGQPAMAITDLSNLFGLIKFYKAARSAGIKPIAGCDVWLQNEHDRDKPYRLLLLASSQQGYLSLCELLSQAWLDNQYRGRAELRREWLQGRSGLIVLSGGRAGDVGQLLEAGNMDEAAAAADQWAKSFPGSYYIELQRSGHEGDETYVQAAMRVAASLDLPVVATHPVQFLEATDFRAHEARVCIAEGEQLGNARRVRRFTQQQYLLSTEEMVQRFADVPVALANAVEIAKRCNLTLVLDRPRLPDFPTPDGITLDDHMAQLAEEGLALRMQQLFPDEAERQAHYPQYLERLRWECKTIIGMGFPGYFLIVADFINWGKNNGVPVGPGRGSGAGSLVAYALGITDLDPLRYDLLFERFLNPERVSMPDFDVDFCMDGRDRVIDYVAQRYGRERVSQIITYGTMAAKAVVRDVARVFGMSYGYADSIAKLIPFELGITLKDALEKEPELKRRYETEEETRAVLDMAMSLEGLVRNAGMHAGGVVIAPSVLTDFAPLFCDDSGRSVVTQFDK